MADVLESGKLPQELNEDFMAMLMGAGISVEKADHPSLRGFLREHTAIEGMLHGASTLCKPANVTSLMGSHRRACLKGCLDVSGC